MVKQQKYLWYWGAGIVLVFLIVLFIVLSNGPEGAYLSVMRQQVEVSEGTIWSQAQDGQKLSLNDKVRTLDGEAAIMLENMVTRLEPDTEVKIADLTEGVTVAMEKGSTWNKVFGLVSGQQATVSSPTVVAMVRGTEFGVGDDGLLVAEGEVIGEIGGVQYTVGGMKWLHPNGTITDVDPQVVLPRLRQTLRSLKEMRLEEARKHPVKVKILMKAAGISGTLEEIFEQIDRGDLDYKAGIEKSPIKLKDMQRIILLTEEIMKQQELIKQVEGMV